MKGIEGSKLGRYELRCRVARGGMSEVYLGYDHRVRRWVAVKVLYGSDEPFVRRFEHEALAIGALSHEHILPLYDFGEQRPWYYLVMPYVEGGTLRDYLFKRERLTLEEAGSFLEQMASGLQHAHDHGVVHRDVKPSNILLRPDGHAYLADFGLAKAKLEASHHSHTGATVGTPEYMAPEQSNGINDYRSDIYSLGVILYQMLTGHVPFTAETPVAVSLKHLQTPPTPPTQFNSDIPPSIEEVVLKALAKQPDERYQQANVVSLAYRKALWQERITQQREVLSLPAGTVEEASTEHILPQPTHTLTAPIIDTPLKKIQLFPLGYETSLLPTISGAYHKKKKRTRSLLTILICLLLLLVALPAYLFWQTSHIAQHHPSRRSPSVVQQQRTTATARALATNQATLAAEARIQATAGVTSAIGAGQMLYYDEMTSKGGGWIDDGRQCYFSPQGYHVDISLPHALAWCYSNQQLFSNAVMTTQVQLLRGDFCGLVFRLSPRSKAFYALEINSSGQYRFQRAQGSAADEWLTLIDWTSSNAILSGYGQINTLLVVAEDSNFRFYINRQLVTSTFSDSAYSAGLIGLMVGEDSSNGTEAVFSHVGVFQK